MSAAISAEGIPRRILGAWRAGFFGMYVSYDLLHELKSVLLRPYFRDRLTYLDVRYVDLAEERLELLREAEALLLEVVRQRRSSS